MQIFGANLVNAVSGFLHTGYISAYPRTYSFSGDPSSLPQVEMEVGEALRLEGEAVGGLIGNGGGDGVASSLSHWPSLLMMTMAFFGAVAMVMLAKRNPRLATVMLVMLVASGSMMCAEESAPLPTEVPWEGVELRSYVDPVAATTVILHGLIADGLINTKQEVASLPNIQREVGWPKAELSEGEAYALQTYGLDGWGRPFDFRVNGAGYEVRSAGADGQLYTDDDLVLMTHRCSNETWDHQRHAHFFRRNSAGEVVVLYHRWGGDYFKYANKSLAATLAGNGLFDAQPVADFFSYSEPLQQAWREKVSDPSVMVLAVLR